MTSSPVFAYVIGAPGSGKGTLCKRLFDDHNVIHLSIGDIARQAAAKTNPSAELVEHVRSGTLLPVQAISQFLEDAMDPPEHADMQCIFMIDGAPRKLDQIKHLEDTLGPPAFVLFLDCSEEVARGRVLRRNFEGRIDTREMFQKRYAEFETENPAIVEYYREKGQLIEINTSTDTDTSYASLVAMLELKRNASNADERKWKWWMTDE